MRSAMAVWLTAILAFGLGGCSGPTLVPTPNLYIDQEADPFADVPEALRGSSVDVLYVTDRMPVQGEDGSLGYDHRRSTSLAFGSAIVRYGEDISWEDLVNASRVEDRDDSLEVSLESVVEKHRFPATPYPLVENPDSDALHRLLPAPEAVAAQNAAVEALHAELRERLAKTPRKEAFVFIHGYNNDFEHSVSVIAAIWHFLPRIGVPIAYSWPAGHGGMRGYFYDRESGEFTIYHLKQFLRALLTCKELEGVHLIAHSRGTDVTLTAMREVYLEAKGTPQEGKGAGKLFNLICAAPDLDLSVIRQRIAAEEFLQGARRVTIYMSKTDAAIGLSTWLFSSDKRVGRLEMADVTPEMLQRSNHMRNMALIDARVDTGFIGHSYFYSHPAVLSDLILILRDGRAPGAANGRPLSHDPGSILWRISEEYPRSEED